jgi:ATP-dependent Lon protease
MSDLKSPIDEEGLPPSLPELNELGENPDETFRPSVPSELSLLPLRDSVIYPMLIAPLSVSRESSVQLIDESIVGNNRVIGVVAQRKPHIEQPTFDDVFEVGCAVIIRTLVKMPDAVRLIVQGISRFRIVEGSRTKSSKLFADPSPRSSIKPSDSILSFPTSCAA